MNSVVSSSSVYIQIDIYPRKVDWQQILNDMKQAGMAYSAQATALGKEWSTFQRWMEGSELKYGDGTALLRLHMAVCGESLTIQRLNEVELLI